MDLQFAKYEYNYIAYGPKVSDNSDIYSSNVKYAVKHVTINGFCYKKDTIIVVDNKDNTPMFGKINKIFVVDDEIIFQYLALRTLGFNTDYFAYTVTYLNTIEHNIAFNKLASKSPWLLFEEQNALFIATRHTL